MPPMELNHDIIDTPPRDSASVVMLRDSADGLAQHGLQPAGRIAGGV